MGQGHNAFSMHAGRFYGVVQGMLSIDRGIQNVRSAGCELCVDRAETRPFSDSWVGMWTAG